MGCRGISDCLWASFDPNYCRSRPGVGTVVFFKGGVAPKDVTSAAVALAAGIPIVGAISYAVGSSEELTDIYGAAVLKYLWAVCLAAFVMGAVFGSGVP
jgi:hypothetical protein